MGNLKPGATYVYERDKGVTYAREFGSDPNTRQAIGWDYKPNYQTTSPSNGQLEVDNHNEWVQIRIAGKQNPALQKAIDNVIMLYKLSIDQK